MKAKNYVTLEIAKELKLLGFNEECEINQLDKEAQDKAPEGTQRAGEFLYPAPLWQEATEWINKEHGLFINIEDCRHGEPTDKLPNGYMYYVTEYGHCVIGRGVKAYPTEYDACLNGIVSCINYIIEVLNKE